MNSDNLRFISNNVKGIQKLEKRIKIFEYLKNSTSSNGFIFFRETHSSYCGVAIGYVGSKSFILANQTADKNDHLLLIEDIVDDVKFILINVYNCNIESQQLLTLTELNKILQNVDDIGNKNRTIGGDFNFHFNSKLEAKGGKPTLKKKFIRKMFELIESFELCDMWRIRNPTEKRFAFRQNHISGYI